MGKHEMIERIKKDILERENHIAALEEEISSLRRQLFNLEYGAPIKIRAKTLSNNPIEG